MSPLTLYTPQNGVFLKTVLDAMVAFLKEDTFQSAIEIMMILSVSLVGYQYVTGKKLESLVRFFLTTFLVSSCLIGIRVPVAIIDMQWADGAGEALRVDSVPLGVALPGAIISGMGYGITTLFSDVFKIPGDLDYNRTGMIFGARTWLAATNTRLSMSPDLATDMSAYIRQCVFGAKLLASHQLSPEELVNSANLIKTYFDNPSPVYRVILHNGSNLSCIDAASNLKARLPVAAKRELARLGHLMMPEDKLKTSEEKIDDNLQAAHDYFMKISTNSAAILTQNILINATRDAASDAFAFSGADAALMNYTNTTSTQKMHVAEANSFWLASFRLPYYMTVMWMLTLCIFPLVVLIAYLPIKANVYMLYLQSQVFLWSWPPMFIIIHFFVSLASSTTISLFGQKTGGVTFSNIDSLVSLHSNFAYTAGALAASVPFLAYYITKGLGPILSNAAQHFGGMAQSLSVGEAQSAAQGNVSMASYSGWNMNYDNTNAHKFDTNRHHAEGRSTLQMANGALLSQNADGSRVGNSQPAISSAAVSVHASDRVVDSLHQSANKSFSNASQMRTAADSHIQAGLSQLKNFTESDANDIRSGKGVSNTSTDSISQDLRTMKDAVRHFNNHHDGSFQVSAEAAITERLSSNKQFIGKAIEFGTGASIEASLTGRAQATQHNSLQRFYNSSQGQAFNEAFNHMVSTAQNSHLDATDTRNLSQSEQIAANFASGQSLLDSASSEYSHGQQLQKAATHARENAQSIDSNLNQVYHDWVVERYGAHGEQVMLQADSVSIATQNKWASEFLNSSAGHSAVSGQVKSALATTGDQLHADYKNEAAHIKQSNDLHGQYQKEANAVDSKASGTGLQSMSAEHVKAAQDMQEKHRLSSVTGDAATIARVTQYKLKGTDKDIDYKKLNKEQ
ncbi:TPA: conjugal transfer protein TraG N-terminal domain-containing protein [Legionella anisa]|uniref:conjugal transfer protein TraG N-terminal domain-containing protein n=1 Tax=Legionella anisa TaxID=28082 RepID=UPI0019823EE5|nr:conjugal transfer protein TraG N-terminal domain-containing protein [Legionella anisa]MBN5937217.1 conjugal transfer protein TraG N-terminal domain-containing protein [Legionella anisa]